MEIKPFLLRYREEPDLFRQEIDVLITGIGLTATTYHLSRQLSIKKPSLVIQAGVAGCFDKRIPLGTVVSVKQDTIADQSVVELKQLKTLFDLKLVPANEFPYQQGWLRNPHTELTRSVKLKSVKGISVNEITTSAARVRQYQELFNPVTESMEGAALHYTCLMEAVPFIQLRSLSNYIAERNKKKWNMQESIVNLNNELIRMFQSL